MINVESTARPITSSAAALGQRAELPSTAAAPRRRRSPVKRALLMLVLLLALVGALTTTAAPKASAAGYATATVCFTQRGGGAFTGYVAAEYYTSAGWARVSYLKLPTGGCETIGVAPGYWVRFSVAHRGFYGYTGQAFMPAGSYVRFSGIAYY